MSTNSVLMHPATDNHIEMAALDRIIAHRGASAEAPENTLAAIDLAYRQGARCMEIDVRISADDIPFVHHDVTLDRCTDASGPLSSHTAKVLDGVNAAVLHPAYSPEPLPRLAAIIDWFTGHEATLNIEVKPEPGLEVRAAEAIANLIETRWPRERRLVFSCLCIDSLRILRDRLPAFPRALIMHEEPLDALQDTLAELECCNLHFNKEIAGTVPLDALKARGYGLYCYTVNDVEHARELLAAGVDGVFTDYPARFITAFEAPHET
ncbi:MAG: hypothetical protein CSB44_11100 [Gammaproteobacteria bacterium]|nr:MAG: hypothetical protein CSB44_11100 [Gammaproteobacteria bacterium]